MGKRNIIILGSIFLLSSVVLLTTYVVKYQENSFADEIITEASIKFENRFKQLLSNSSDAIVMLKNKIKNENDFNEQSLTQDLSKIILNERTISGIALSGKDFSYVINREKNSWAVTFDTDLTDSVSNWIRLNNNLEVISEWTDIYKAFPSTNQIESIKKHVTETDYYWIASEKVSSEIGNAISVIFSSENLKYGNVFTGIIYQTQNLSSNFSAVLEFERPLVSIIADNNDIITPVVTSDTSSLLKYNSLSKQVKSLVSKWLSNSSLEARSFSFNDFSDIYWTRIVPTNSSIGIRGFAVTLSASDLAETEKKQELFYLYAGVIAAIIGIIIYLLLLRKNHSETALIFDENELSSEQISRLIKKGETEFVEFKSSLRWDYREQKVNKVLERVILKSINAFANAKGGNLFIGVSDDLKILGLDNDFSTLHKQDADYFELHLRKLIVNQYGIGFSNESLNITFPELEGKIICLIRIKPAENPLFLKTKDKQGTEVEKFYVRSGNASHELSSLSDINKYIKRRF